MIWVMIALIALTVAFFICYRNSVYWEELWIAFRFLCGVGVIIVAPSTIKWHIGTAQYTGYVYATNTAFGYTYGSLRLAEYAGADDQPDFCVIDSEMGDYVRALAGSGQKVKITVTSKGMFFANNPFACAGHTTIQPLAE